MSSHLTHLDVEDRLIVAACRREGVGELDIEQLGAGFAGWSAAGPLLERLHAHHVAGLALTTLDRHGWIERAGEISSAAARKQLSRERRRGGLFAMELERLGAGLAGRDIECVALKGAGLAASVYDSPAERFLSDIDLLVRPEDVDRTLEFLLAFGYENPWSPEALEGYRTYHYHVPLARPDGIIVELHWALVKPDRPYRVDPLGVLERAVPIPDFTGPLRMPSVEDQILHAVAQQWQDGFTYFSRSVDLDRLIARGNPDWDLLAARAVEYRLGTALAYALQVARHLLVTEVPAGMVERLAPGRLARAHLSLFDPVRSALTQRFVGHPTAYDLLRLWLTQADSSRLSVLADLMRETEEPDPVEQPWMMGDRQTHTSRRRGLVGLAKLAARQVVTYLHSVAGLPTGRFRAQMRFWSSQFNSSERL